MTLGLNRQDLSAVIDGNITLEETNSTLDNETMSDEEEEGLAMNVTVTDFLSDLPGRCLNVPSGIHVDVMYTVAGLANWQPIYRIVGAKIRSAWAEQFVPVFVSKMSLVYLYAILVLEWCISKKSAFCFANIGNNPIVIGQVIV